MFTIQSSKHLLTVLLCCVLIQPLTGCGEENSSQSSLATMRFTETGKEPSDESPKTNETQSSDDVESNQENEDWEEYDGMNYDSDLGPGELSNTQRNSINMLNYMTVLTQQINEAKSNQLFLESAYSSLVNDIYPNSVDMKTQAQITSLMDTIDKYRMVNVKRERLNYIYEKNRAQAFRQAIPNPVALLSTAATGNLLKNAASVLYMAIDSVTSYKAAASQAELQFVQDGWELDDEESAELHNSTKKSLSYMLDMVREYDLPGDYALNKESVENFVFWSQKPESQVINKIAWFESHKGTYEAFGPYWIELAKNYFDAADYENCLKSIEQYETVMTRIFRKNEDYSNVLPMAIISAKETMSKDDYVKAANEYCELIIDNTKDSDWSLKYFAAQIYLDLYSNTNDTAYIDKAYKLVFDNVVVLVDEQKRLNLDYIDDVREIKADKGASKREKNEIKAYNKFLKEERKIALPPVSEALYLNCELLFKLAEKKNISSQEQKKIEAILHENGEGLFLTKAIDDMVWFDKKSASIKQDEVNIDFTGVDLKIPAALITDRSQIIVTVTGNGDSKVLDDWTVTSVKRPKGADVSDFLATLHSKKADAYKAIDKYQPGHIIEVKITPVAESSDKYVDIRFKAISVKKFYFFSSVGFERIP